MRAGAAIGQEAQRAWKMIERTMALDALSENGCGRSPDPDELPYAYSFRADANRALAAPRAAETPLAALSAVMFRRNRQRLADFSITDLLLLPIISAFVAESSETAPGQVMCSFALNRRMV